jgi:hypothetical protein
MSDITVRAGAKHAIPMWLSLRKYGEKVIEGCCKARGRRAEEVTLPEILPVTYSSLKSLPLQLTRPCNQHQCSSLPARQESTRAHILVPQHVSQEKTRRNIHLGDRVECIVPQ